MTVIICSARTCDQNYSGKCEAKEIVVNECADYDGCKPKGERE